MMEGRRVKLRPLSELDTDDVVRWRSAPEILAQMFADEPPTRARHLEWLAGIQARGDRREFVIVESAIDRAIGTVGLGIDGKNQRAEFGILIGEPDARGKGYAHEAGDLILRHAFDDLKLHRVYLQVFAGNRAAIKLYEALGFSREGTLRQHVLKRGVFQDVLIMAIVQSDDHA
jgi:UDP-4-amino-4,6-dideoxy-N-acetyl-beta-L-altrosamine N-acetyltransferase